MKSGLLFLKNFYLVLIFLFIGTTGLAQEVKHNRVLQLEKIMTKEALELLKGRFPDKPFLVSVKIEPMMRDRGLGGRGDNGNSEKLPYFDMMDEEIVDEWDDPAIPMTTLMNRVKKVQINVSVPNLITDDDLAELKNSLIQNLGLLAARDTVDITKRNWTNPTSSQDPQNNKSFPWEIFGIGVLLAFIFTFGLFLISSISVTKISDSIRDAGVNGKGGGGGGIVNATVTSGSSTSHFSDSPVGRSVGGSSDLRLMDPIKNREIIKTGLKILHSYQGFPCLEDMLILHRAAQETPSALGALLGEFPLDLKQKIFSFSFGNKWLEAMIDPSDVTSLSLEILNRCLKVPRNTHDESWQEFLILVWRLDHLKKDFFSSIPQSDAFAILKYLPKTYALEAARECFPGAWGQLLDPSYSAQTLAKDKITEYRIRSLKILPLRDSQVLENYKNERELLDFLKTSDPVAEKEIYQASGPDSMVWKIRPPFFKVFELKQEDADKLFPQFRIEDWAMAFFNVNRLERREIEKRMSDKQKFRYFESLKSFDIKNPSRNQIGDVREAIGKAIQILLDQAHVEAENSSDNNIESLKKVA